MDTISEKISDGSIDLGPGEFPFLIQTHDGKYMLVYIWERVYVITSEDGYHWTKPIEVTHESGYYPYGTNWALYPNLIQTQDGNYLMVYSSNYHLRIISMDQNFSIIPPPKDDKKTKNDVGFIPGFEVIPLIVALIATLIYFSEKKRFVF
jgi:hypothetical protein